ncbi:MAG: GNAT family N-acetyltransferase [Planctomycetota bacterium]
METAQTPEGAAPDGGVAGAPAPATTDDRAAQAALFDASFQREDGARVLPWRYDSGPHGEAITMVVRGDDGGVLSSYACGPRRVLSKGGGEATIGQTGDVMTSPEARGKGHFSALDRAVMAAAREAGWPAVFGLPNRASAHIFVRDLGWEEVGQLRPWTFVLCADAGARAERMKASRAASALVPWTAWRGTMARGKLRKRFFGKINVVPIARFKPEADDVAKEVGAGEDWFVRRDHEYLNWRFIDAPSGRFRVHGVYEPSGAMRGWCVVQLPERGETAGFVVDVVAADDIAFAGALEAGLGHLRKAGASVARAHAVVGSAWDERLRASGFRAARKDDVRPIILHVLDPKHPIIDVARAPERWFFTDGDRDAEIVS